MEGVTVRRLQEPSSFPTSICKSDQLQARSVAWCSSCRFPMDNQMLTYMRKYPGVADPAIRRTRCSGSGNNGR